MRFFTALIATLSVCSRTHSFSGCSIGTGSKTSRRLTDHHHWHLIDHAKCGDSSTDRIIGGKVANLGDYPWLARLGYQGSDDSEPGFKCGGSLINHLYVLTAAHCLTALGEEKLTVVRLGEYDATKEIDCDDEGCAPAVQDFAPTKLITNKQYNMVTFSHDIALVRLNRPAQYNLFVRPICLPYGQLLRNKNLPRTFTVAGWGVTDMSTLKVSDVPLFVRLNRVDMEQCLEGLQLNTSSGGQLCVGGEEGFDSCSGDSGGPLMVAAETFGPPRVYQMGIVSFGSENCGSDKPAVYTDVRHYMGWILDHIEP